MVFPFCPCIPRVFVPTISCRLLLCTNGGGSTQAFKGKMHLCFVTFVGVWNNRGLLEIK
ncbi:hypothetical protein HanIR_Chr13g0629831 [Helianthus annuus]|nr:hypothetical protein HanIR_Chr13g0629831 [Helianthus annuus]